MPAVYWTILAGVLCLFGSVVQAQPVCGTEVQLDQSHTLTLQRDTSHCTGTPDKDRAYTDFQNIMADLPGSCLSMASDAVQCCLYPENGNCKSLGSISMPANSIHISGSSSTDQIAGLIRTNITEQNRAAVRAEACRISRVSCSDACLNEQSPNGAMYCEKLVAFEHCEKAQANAYLTNACGSMVPLTAASDSETESFSVTCSSSGQALVCQAY